MSLVGQWESLAAQAPADREDEEEGKQMGRHRRPADGRAATGRAAEVHTQPSTTGREDPQYSYPRDRQDPQDPQDSYARHSYAGEIVRREQASRVIAPYTGGQAPRSITPYTRDGAPRGIAPYLNPEFHTPATGLQPLDHADATAKAHAYLFAQDGPGGAGGGGRGFTPTGSPSPGHRRRKKGARPVRAGLLGMSAAVALGTAAVAAGVVPGLQNYRLGGDTHTTGGERVQAADATGNTAAEQGGTSGGADSPVGGDIRPGGADTSRDSARPQSPTPSASGSQSASASPTPTPSRTAAHRTTPPAGKPKSTPPGRAKKAAKAGSTPAAVSTASAAEAQVLKLVNQERAKVGCSPLATNSSLAALAESFSNDMAARGFFDHTDPDGKTPWDRAAAAGITDLGGENIARGQTDAAAVMQAWMNSPGHRANILNCDFKTLGVGVHFGPGGPWWTQDFGY